MILASNPAVSERTGSPIGFWWAELAHPFWEFTERGYEVDVASPQGGALHGRFKPHAVRHGNLITGQQQHSGRAAARLAIDALGT